ncbi:MAG: phenylalanine--tRNA ligase subunit beta [Bacteroidales bacterium]|jgi:phenylalanyl-tRNA synthetase beta chain|nr:phenylalanine--tRNA ligase subunit beta [Bacteroidales bacterium]
MNISYKWLKDYLKFDLTPEETSAALTSIGLETEGVEEIETIKGGLKGLVVGHVLTCEPHPDSDHMHVTTVDLGGAQWVKDAYGQNCEITADGHVVAQIVCGAPNVAAGQKVIVATLGTVLYDGDQTFTIKKAKLRGVPSNGMICAEDEIGVGTDHAGIIELPADVKVGTLASEYYHIESDYVIAVDITPNRIDAASHYGVARDLNAYLGAHGLKHELTKPSVAEFDKVLANDASATKHIKPVEIRVENSEACPRYSGITIEGVTVKESPEWLKSRLQAIGLRPINNIVDITNFILHETAVPMHTFDYDKIKGGQIVVRTCAEGTKFVTLDGNEHKLSERDLMICNSEEPMCIAGVFGGLESGTTTETKNVFLECAYFHPTCVRKTARRHQLSTDASFRYERGIDINNVPYALRRAALLVKELAGGTIVGNIVDEYPVEFKPFNVELTYKRVNTLTGIDIPQEMVKKICGLLEMQIVEESADGLKLKVPNYRVDVTRDCDVIEDILRIYGYDRVELPGNVRMCAVTKTQTDINNHIQQIISEQLTGAGYSEILCNSLTSESFYKNLQTYPAEKLVHVMNPLSGDLNVMRQTLLFGGLQSIIRNINFKNVNCRFYEFGNTQFYNAEKQEAVNQQVASGEKTALQVQQEGRGIAGYSEEAHLGLWLTGNRATGSWARADQKSSVFELKAAVLNVLRRLGLADNLRQRQFTSDIYSAGLELTTASGKVLATLGIVTNKVLKMFDIEQEVYYADMNWNVLMKETAKVKVEQEEISKFPPVKRDLALLVDKNIHFADIERVANETERKLLKSVTLFDVYEGKNLPEGKKSYAISLILQDVEKTLVDKQIDAIMQKFIKAFESKLGASLR